MANDTVQSIEAGAKSVAATATADAAKVVAEYGFVRANWGKLSAIIVASALVGLILGHIL